jgi:hypothetical protein
MSVFLSPVFGAGAQLFDNKGVVLALGTINTFIAGSTTPIATYIDNTQTTQNGVSIALDAAGRPPNEIWLVSGSQYKFIVKDANGNTVGIAYDNISGINDPGAGSGGSLSVWVATATPTFISASQFSVPGDLRTTFPVGTRVKTTNTAGTVYGSVTAVAFTTFTTVTVQPDTGSLDSGLSVVAVSINGIVGQNVSSGAIAYLASLTYPAGSLGLTVQGNVASIASLNTTVGHLALVTRAVLLGGTSTALTLAPDTAIASYITGQTWLAIGIATGASPTINISGQGAKNLKQYTSAGTKVFATLVAGAIYALGYDGTDVIVLNPTQSSSGKLLRITKFTASGTWTKQADTTTIMVEGVAGGGGGGVQASGGGGGYFKVFVATPGATEAVTIGAGGSLGTSTGGNNGTSTLFGAWGSASGGSGTGAGGVGTIGDVKLGGNAGSAGGGGNNSGGGSVFGGGGWGGFTNSGNDGIANTGGGGGAGQAGGQGGNGAAGQVIVYEYS